jgi:hypothetical protein
MSESERIAIAEFDGRKIAVRVDGEWCFEIRWYTDDRPVFYPGDGSEIDVRKDGTIMYETPEGAVQREIEPYLDEGGVASYLPHRVYPADNIEIHEVGESKAVSDWSLHTDNDQSEDDV